MHVYKHTGLAFYSRQAFFNKIYFIIYVYGSSAYMCVCALCEYNAFRGQKKSDPLELELQLWAFMWVLESNLSPLKQQPVS